MGNDRPKVVSRTKVSRAAKPVKSQARAVSKGANPAKANPGNSLARRANPVRGSMVSLVSKASRMATRGSRPASPANRQNRSPDSRVSLVSTASQAPTNSICWVIVGPVASSRPGFFKHACQPDET
jgi:hypothetical protein